MTLLLLVIVPRDVDALAKPVLIRIFVVCVLNSTRIVSSAVAGRANGHMNDYRF